MLREEEGGRVAVAHNTRSSGGKQPGTYRVQGRRHGEIEEKRLLLKEYIRELNRGNQKKRRTVTIGGVEEMVWCQYEREGKEGEKQREGNKTQLSFSSQRPMRLRVMIKRRRAMEKEKGREREGKEEEEEEREVQLGVTSQAGGAVFPLSTWERARPVILVPAVSGAGQTHRTP